MLIVNKLIHGISADLKLNQDYILSILSHVQNKGYLTKQELMQFDENGLPMTQILKNVLSVDFGDLDRMIEFRKISYSDILCIIGVIAQDLKVRSQERFLNRYR